MDSLLILLGFVAALIPGVLVKRVHNGPSTVKRTARGVLFSAAVFCGVVVADEWLMSYGRVWDSPGQTSPSVLIMFCLSSVGALVVSAFLEQRTSGGCSMAVTTLSLIEACAFSVILFFVAISWCLASREFPMLLVILLPCVAALVWRWEPAIRSIRGSSTVFRMWLLLSLMVAIVSFYPPSHTMPIDYRLAIWSSLPLSGVWAILALTLLLMYKKLGLWTLIGLPTALFWPMKLLQGLPDCYWTHNCI